VAIDLTAVCLRPPDAEVCDRLTKYVLRLATLRSSEDQVTWYEPPTGTHEFDYEHVVSFGAGYRSATTYVRMLVLASSAALLYDGRLVDDTGFFPALSASDVLSFCSLKGSASADQLWAGLKAKER
jgi:hypothetical protein